MMIRAFSAVLLCSMTVALVGCGGKGGSVDPEKSAEQMKKEMDDMNAAAAKSASK